MRQVDDLSYYTGDDEERMTDIYQDVESSEELIKKNKKTLENIKKRNGIYGKFNFRDYFHIKYVFLAIVIFFIYSGFFKDLLITKSRGYINKEYISFIFPVICSFIYFFYENFLL